MTHESKKGLTYIISEEPVNHSSEYEMIQMSHGWGLEKMETRKMRQKDMLKLTKLISGLFLPILLFTGACSAPASVAPTQSQPVKATTYDDPFAYCAAVGTIDSPDAEYTGPKMPNSIIDGMIAQGIITADMPPEIQKNAVWRCMDAHVWACHFGANLPCLEKANTSETPTSEMEDYCKTNPNVDTIPAAVTGRATVYIWKCTSGKPAVIRQAFQVDPQGYLANFWYELVPK